MERSGGSRAADSGGNTMRSSKYGGTAVTVQSCMALMVFQLVPRNLLAAGIHRKAVQQILRSSSKNSRSAYAWVQCEWHRMCGGCRQGQRALALLVQKLVHVNSYL